MDNNEMNNLGTPNTGKGFSIAGLVLGILATILAWFYVVNIVALVLGIVGLVMAVMGRKHARLANAPSGIATAGLVLSIIGTCLAGVGFLSCTLCVWCAADSLNDLANSLSSL